jgi:hypothetical protein
MKASVETRTRLERTERTDRNILLLLRFGFRRRRWQKSALSRSKHPVPKSITLLYSILTLVGGSRTLEGLINSVIVLWQKCDRNTRAGDGDLNETGC